MVTFTSNVLVNGAGGAVSRFSEFSLGSTDGQVFEVTSGLVGFPNPVTMTFTGRNLLNSMDALLAVVCDGVFNGGPRRNQAGFWEATAVRGELLTVTIPGLRPDCDDRDDIGILWGANFSVTRGGLSQRLDVIFHRAERLRFTNHIAGVEFLDPAPPFES